jgi:hypothetical protein
MGEPRSGRYLDAHFARRRAMTGCEAIADNKARAVQG